MTKAPLSPDFEFLDSVTPRITQFLYEDPWRVLRIQSDAIHSIETMTRAVEGVSRIVAVFGSARLDEASPYYKQACETSRLLGERGIAILTGGGPGIMEAANRGARDAEALSIGLNIQLPREQFLNAYTDYHCTCHYFFVRKMMFAKYARGFVIFPGGFGTMDELFESLTLIQTEKLAEFPVVLSGSDYWNPLTQWLNDTMVHHGCIDADDMNRFVTLDDPERIAEYLDQTIPATRPQNGQ